MFQIIEKAEMILEEIIEKIIIAKEKFLAIILKPFVWLDPDLLSATRMVLVFPIILTLLTKKDSFTFVIFISGAILDLIDGRLARLRGRKAGGEFIDIVADKLFFGVTFILLFYLRSPISRILFRLIMAAEGIVLFSGLTIFLEPIKRLIKNKGWKITLNPNNYGKSKCVFYTIGLSLILCNCFLFAEITLWIALIFAILSIIKYIKTALSQI